MILEIAHALCDSQSHFFLPLIKPGWGKKKKKSSQRGGNSEAVGGEMRHESGRMNFIQEKDISINILSSVAGGTMIPGMNTDTPLASWIHE